MTLHETSVLGDHLRRSQRGLAALQPELARLERWGAILRLRLDQGGRLLVAGNGGSAALACHLTGELVGRYDRERPPYSALTLAADPAALTAIGNDYGYDEVFARQVAAHGRPGDVLLALSTSGRSTNLLRATAEGRRQGAGPVGHDGTGPQPPRRRGRRRTAHPLHRNPQRPGRPAGGRPPAVHGLRDGRGTGMTGRAAGAPRVTVVGDTLLDVDWTGEVTRLCPDAPAPVLDHRADHARPGGAGLAARLRGRGRRPRPPGHGPRYRPRGRPAAGLLDEAGVQVVDLGLDGPTPVKLRLRAGERSLLRVDRACTPVAAPGPWATTPAPPSGPPTPC